MATDGCPSCPPMSVHRCPWTFTPAHQWLSVTPLVITSGSMHDADGCPSRSHHRGQLIDTACHSPGHPCGCPPLLPHPDSSAIGHHSLRLPAAPAWWWWGPMPRNPKGSPGFPWGAGFMEQPLALGCSDTSPLPLLSPPVVTPRYACGAAVLVPLQTANEWQLLCASCSLHSPCRGLGYRDRDMDGDSRSWLSPCPRWPGCPEQELPGGAQQGRSPSFGPRQQPRSNEPEVG